MTKDTTPFTLKELLDKAGEGYENLDMYYFEDGSFDPYGHGDGLAMFIVRELSDTFDTNLTKSEKLEEAIRMMQNAIRDLENVVEALEG